MHWLEPEYQCLKSGYALDQSGAALVSALPSLVSVWLLVVWVCNCPASVLATVVWFTKERIDGATQTKQAAAQKS